MYMKKRCNHQQHYNTNISYQGQVNTEDTPAWIHVDALNLGMGMDIRHPASCAFAQQVIHAAFSWCNTQLVHDQH